jgi:hypothetical protein
LRSTAITLVLPFSLSSATNPPIPSEELGSNKEHE